LRRAGQFRLKVARFDGSTRSGTLSSYPALIAALLLPLLGFCLWPRGKTKAIETAQTRNQVALGHQTPPLALLGCALTLERTALDVIA
jgi:hypothetical protein